MLKDKLLNREEDIETKTVESRGKLLKELSENPGWHLAKSILSDKILDIQSIMNIDDTDPIKVFQEVQTRRIAAGLILEWLQEIEGTAQQYEANTKTNENVRGAVIRL